GGFRRVAGPNLPPLRCNTLAPIWTKRSSTAHVNVTLRLTDMAETNEAIAARACYSTVAPSWVR
ncbi:MAG: hypothetical protein AAFO79_06745, partial [Pseudomonadota bacterium]